MGDGQVERESSAWMSLEHIMDKIQGGPVIL